MDPPDGSSGIVAVIRTEHRWHRDQWRRPGRLGPVDARLAAHPISAATRAPRARARCRPRWCPPTSPCTTPNSTHGAPLAFPSCNPPSPTSDLPHDRHPRRQRPPRAHRAPRSRSRVVDTGDVQIDAVSLNDVANSRPDRLHRHPARAACRCGSPTSSTRPTRAVPARPPRSPSSTASRSPAPPTPDPTTGSDCTLATSMNALAPGHPRGRPPRASGSSARCACSTAAPTRTAPPPRDNTVFAVQGVFVP